MPTTELPGYGEPVAWHDLQTIRVDWASAEDIPDTLLTDLLLNARLSVEAFAPALPDEMVEAGMCPVNYRLAHLMQTRNLYNAVTVDSGGGVGEDMDYAYRPMPLDWIVKQVLRPKRSIPVAL